MNPMIYLVLPNFHNNPNNINNQLSTCIIKITNIAGNIITNTIMLKIKPNIFLLLNNSHINSLIDKTHLFLQSLSSILIANIPVNKYVITIHITPKGTDIISNALKYLIHLQNVYKMKISSTSITSIST